MLTQRRNALALAARAGRDDRHGRRAGDRTRSQSAATPSRIHATTVVAAHPPAAPLRGDAEPVARAEGGDS